MAARELGVGLGEVSDMQVSSALAVLERMELIERRSTGSSPGTLDILPTFALKPPGERASIRHRLWKWIEMESGGGDRPRIDLVPETVAQELSLECDQVARGLKALHDDGLVRYVPPFRGRAIALRRRMDAGQIPIDEKALAEKRRCDERKMEDMIGYAYAGGCRQMRLIDYFGGTSVRCGACDACAGTSKLRAPEKAAAVRTKAPRAATAADEDDGTRLFNALRTWRLKRAQGGPAFTVLPDRALHAIVALRPTAMNELCACHGIGTAKAKKYGEEILQVMKRFESGTG